MATDFSRLSTYLYLHISLIRPQLEYACSIWDPNYKKYSEQSEKIQAKFFKSVNYKLFGKITLYNHLPSSLEANIP